MSILEKVSQVLSGLPVASVANNVVRSVLSGQVTLLAAPTGSGKSMMVPAALANALPDDEQVVVLVPRRFLATDAAANVAQIAGVKLGEEVGYAIGEMAGEKSRFSDKTKLLFVTYGYAISSGLINRAKNVVLDEVHEGAEDISLARAILYDRKRNDPSLRLLEMSATVDLHKQAAYWAPVSQAAVHQVEGSQLHCDEVRETPGRGNNSFVQRTIDLLVRDGRKGIAAFRAGVKDVESTVEELKAELKKQGQSKVEVVGIHGGTPADEREKARAAPPEGWRKIIVGTNVIESGVNLRWVDAGISDGFGKIPYDRPDTGAEALVQEHLPQWRIVQQRGRINRAPEATGFPSGLFVLYSNREMEHRPQQATPEIQRRSLVRLAFRAAALGYDPESLHLDAPLPATRMREAKEELVRLGLIDEYWQLTRDGDYVASLPVSPEAGAMLCEAKRLDVAALRSGDAAQKKRPKLLPDVIAMATLIEQGGLRDNGKLGHGFEGKSDVHGGSDVIDSLKAYRQLENTLDAKMVADSPRILASGDEKWIAELEKAREGLKAACQKINVDYTDFCEVMLLVGEIRARHKDARSVAPDMHAPYDASRYNGLKQALLNGYAGRVFARQGNEQTFRDLLRDYGGRKRDCGQAFNGYELSEFSALAKEQQSARTPLLVGALREVPPKAGADASQPQLQIELPTSIPAEVFLAWAAAHEPALLDKISYDRNATPPELTFRYDGRAECSIALPKLTPEISAHLSAIREKQRWSDAVTQPTGHESGHGR